MEKLQQLGLWESLFNSDEWQLLIELEQTMYENYKQELVKVPIHNKTNEEIVHKVLIYKSKAEAIQEMWGLRDRHIKGLKEQIKKEEQLGDMDE